MSGVNLVRAWLNDCTSEFKARAGELNDLDWALGDGDHGTNMLRGFTTANTLDLGDEPTAAEALRQVGMALVSNVGGASGPLFGTFFLRTGAAWPSRLTIAGVETALRDGVAAVMARGKAQPGDKTMIDALLPAADSLADSAADALPLNRALERCADAAEAGRDATAAMVARRGRAALKADVSVGIVDPGAVSMALILRTAIKHVG